MDLTVLTLSIALLALALATLLWFRGKSSDTREQRRRAPPAPQNAREVPAGARGRRGPRMRRGNQPEQGDNEGGEEEELADARLEELEEAGVKVPEGKIGKKKMEKLQMKADKKLAREADERSREESKLKKAELEEEEAKKKVRNEEEERKRKEAEEKEKEEKERREHEEYLKLKAAFQVEEEGFDEEDGEGDEENKLKKFIDYIKETKVVLLEDLAAHFKLKTQETIDRVNQLQEDGLLTGVIDDRGKFIYISQEELEAVAKFIKRRGRVSISELAENSNKLISLSQT